MTELDLINRPARRIAVLDWDGSGEEPEIYRFGILHVVLYADGSLRIRLYNARSLL